jgi:DNA-directed RNA polymerase specialized sigma24 family protein
MASVTQLLNTCRDDPLVWAQLWQRLRHEVARLYTTATGHVAGKRPLDEPRIVDAISNIFLSPRVWPSRAAFFAFLLRALRNAATDEHRRATAAKRGGGVTHVPLPGEGVTAPPADGDRQDLLESLRLKMAELEGQHPTAHAVMEGKLAGRPWADIAGAVGTSVAEAKAHWTLAVGWFRREFDRPGGDSCR